MTLNRLAFKYLGGWSLAGSLFPKFLGSHVSRRLPSTIHQFAPCPLHGSNATDAIGTSLLAVFLNTSAKLKIRAAADLPYKQVPRNHIMVCHRHTFRSTTGLLILTQLTEN